MSFWRKIARRAAERVDGAECGACPPGRPGEDPAFSTAVTALGAKLARADGEDGVEYDAFTRCCANARRRARRAAAVRPRRQKPGIESLRRRLDKRSERPKMIEAGRRPVHSQIDGAMTEHELDYLRRVSELFGLSELDFRRVKASPLGAGSDDPYVVLQLDYRASDTEVRAAWRRALGEAHPDRVIARGLPPEYVEVANDKRRRSRRTRHHEGAPRGPRRYNRVPPFYGEGRPRSGPVGSIPRRCGVRPTARFASLNETQGGGTTWRTRREPIDARRASQDGRQNGETA